MNEREIRVVSLFAGVGGFELGFQRANNNQSQSKTGRPKERRYRNTKVKQTQFHYRQNPTFSTVYSNEVDKYCVQVLKKRFPKTKIDDRDIREVPTSEIPNHNLLVGGFPCQSFSLAGKRRGFADKTRGTLFFEICRLLEAKKPRLVLLENVKGLLSAQKGECFRTILESLGELGYGVEWQVLNSKNFGVPQNRERVFIAGHLGGFPRQKVFPIGQDGEKFDENRREESGIFCQTIDSNYYKGADGKRTMIHSAYPGEVREYEKISPTISTPSGGGHLPMVVGMINKKCKKRMFKTPKEINQFLKESKGDLTIKEISDYIGVPKTQTEHYFRVDGSRAMPSPKIWIKLKKILGFDNRYDKQVTEVYEKEIEYEQTRRVYHVNGLSPTLNSTKEPIIDRLFTMGNAKPGRKCLGANRTPEVGNEYGSVRRLTPIECERLQGFPDNFTLVKMPNGKWMSDTQRYKMMGNAVTVNVIEAIGKRILDVL